MLKNGMNINPNRPDIKGIKGDNKQYVLIDMTSAIRCKFINQSI